MVGSSRHHRPDAAAPQDVAFHADGGEVRAIEPRLRLAAGFDVEQADTVAAGAAGDAPSGDDRHDAIARQSDAPAVEQHRRIAGAGVLPRRDDAAEREHPLVLEEELALLGKEEAEPCQVDLRFIRFDLREVRVVGQVGIHRLREPVADVDADAAVEVVHPSGRRRRIDGLGGRDVRFDVEAARGAGHLHPDDGGSERRLLHRTLPAALRQAGDRRQLVLPAIGPQRVESPQLCGAGLIADRLERNRHFDRPAAFELAYRSVPDRVPVAEYCRSFVT